MKAGSKLLRDICKHRAADHREPNERLLSHRIDVSSVSHLRKL